MIKVGYNLTATIYSLEDEKIQVIKCKKNTKRFITSGFTGSGIATQNQTLEISTKDELLPTVQASQCRCLFEGVWYIITGIFTQDSAPIHNKNRQIKNTVLSLQ